MKTHLHKLMLMTVALGLSGSSLAMADYRDHNDKGWNSLYKAQSARQSMSHSYRTNAPVIVRSESVPTEIAQAPTHDRTYSYEPSQQSDSSSASVKNSDSGQSTVAERPAQTRRSFSYEPSESGPTVGHGYGTSRGETSYDRAMRAKGY